MNTPDPSKTPETSAPVPAFSKGQPGGVSGTRTISSTSASKKFSSSQTASEPSNIVEKSTDRKEVSSVEVSELDARVFSLAATSIEGWEKSPKVLADVWNKLGRNVSQDEFASNLLNSLVDLHGVSAAWILSVKDHNWIIQEKSGSLPSLSLDQMLVATESSGAGWLPSRSVSEIGFISLSDVIRKDTFLFLSLPAGCPEEYQSDKEEFLSQVQVASSFYLHWGFSFFDLSHEQRNSAHLLRLISQWNRTNDTVTLLHEMAHSATEWFGCQRATIFLWDKATGQLIGRPAVGVEGGQLVIPEDAGLVGQVVKSRTIGRVDRGVATQQAKIDRSTDNELGFETVNLLCAPLLASDGNCLGAFELINKGGGDFTDEDQVNLENLSKHAAVAIQNVRKLEDLLEDQKIHTEQAAAEVKLKGESLPVKQVRQTIERVAQTDLSVLILGENGTGKEVAAQLVHYLSDRRDEVLIAINCAAMPDALLESELFGHEIGAFTDARSVRKGKFELASRGTIFLDEIGDMSLAGQAKLLRVLEEKSVVRVGGSVSIPTDARIVAATNQNLMQLVQEKKFREDLFFRLNVVTVEMPALRHRGEDILLLAEYFLDNLCAKARKPRPVISKAVAERMLAYHWPGNVRELRNMMERSVFMGTGGSFQFDQWNYGSQSSAQITNPGNSEQSMTLADATIDFQAEFIRQKIRDCDGNMTEAAKKMGVHRTNLYRKMKQLGMENPDQIK